MKHVVDHSVNTETSAQKVQRARRALAQGLTVWAWTHTGYEACDGARVKHGQLQAHLFDRWVEAEDFDVE